MLDRSACVEAANAKKMKHITTMLLNPRAAPLLVPVYANMPVRVDKSGRLFFVNLRLSDLAPSLTRLGAVPGSGGQPSAADHDAASRGFEVYTRPHTRVCAACTSIDSKCGAIYAGIYIYMNANAGPTSLRQNLLGRRGWGSDRVAATTSSRVKRILLHSVLQLSFEPNSVYYHAVLIKGGGLHSGADTA